MKIGNYSLHPIETGTIGLDGGAMFGVVPKTLWAKTNPPDEKNRITLNMRCLLVRGNGKNILIDCGIGNKFDDGFKSIFNVDTKKYNLDTSLKDAGIEKNEITDVIITHLHFDHVGGTTYYDDGKLKLTFPNATHHIQKAQWEHAKNPSERDKASYFKENFLPIEENNKLNIVDGNTMIYDGIEVIEVNGHTFGQQVVKISDGDNTLLYCGDLIPTSSHIRIPYVMGYDLQPLVTIDEKKKLLKSAADENWVLFYEHDPFCQASYVVKKVKDFVKGEEVVM